jgi:hypothetical protein
MLAADARRRLRLDLDHARGAERVWIAGTGRGGRGTRLGARLGDGRQAGNDGESEGEGAEHGFEAMPAKQGAAT